MNNKKSIIAIFAVCLLGVIGSTIAYYVTSKTFANVFNTTNYAMSVTEIFDSPDDWTPGTTTDKRIIAVNNGSVGAAVRISYEEEWTDSSGNSIPLTDDQSPANRYAIINFGNSKETNWLETVENGKTYYYYKGMVAPGETTTSFIKSVTYNTNTVMSTDDGCTRGADNNLVCTSTMDPHVGGQYKLTITVETVQFDKYKEAWGTNIELAENTVKPYTVLSGTINTLGSVVKIADEEFYVLGLQDQYHVKLLSKYNLGAGYGYDTPLDRQDPEASCYLEGTWGFPYKGSIDFSSTNYWSGTTETGFHNVYNEKSLLYPYIESYTRYLGTQGAETTGRLLEIQEVQNLINNGVAFTEGQKMTDAGINLTGKEWLFSTSYWTGSANAATNKVAMMMSNTDWTPQNYNVGSGGWGIRPVIVLEL